MCPGCPGRSARGGACALTVRDRTATRDGEVGMAGRSGKGSDTADKADEEGKENPRTSSAA